MDVRKVLDYKEDTEGRTKCRDSAIICFVRDSKKFQYSVGLVKAGPHATTSKSLQVKLENCAGTRTEDGVAELSSTSRQKRVEGSRHVYLSFFIYFSFICYYVTFLMWF